MASFVLTICINVLRIYTDRVLVPLQEKAAISRFFKKYHRQLAVLSKKAVGRRQLIQNTLLIGSPITFCFLHQRFAVILTND